MTRYVGIDPSTKTGLVVLDEDGEVWEEIEIEKQGEDPRRMYNLIAAVMALIMPGDKVAIEGFGFASESGFLLGGIGWGIRMELFRRGIDYIEVAPAALKKFTGAGGTAAKEVLAVEVYKRWGFQSKSNNVTDAFVLAHIARAMNERVQITKFQEEVLTVIRTPPVKKARKKSKRKAG
ncbi:hypothetical protein [Gorillibacterium sp. sgz5001074]|uniref:hypothetical protein n=1 Tax=Gorillibacterium sp. sgz5001074 TaxID=3446695 RepID=UPI003F66B3EC